MANTADLTFDEWVETRHPYALAQYRRALRLMNVHIAERLQSRTGYRVAEAGAERPTGGFVIVLRIEGMSLQQNYLNGGTFSFVFSADCRIGIETAAGQELDAIRYHTYPMNAGLVDGIPNLAFLFDELARDAGNRLALYLATRTSGP